MPIYGDGGNLRDWLHVEDHCRAIELVLGSGGTGETYNIGGGEELPNLTIIDGICTALDEMFAQQPQLALRFASAPPAKGRSSASLKTHVTDRKGHDRRYAMDGTKIERDLGYAPAYNLAHGLRETVRWYLDNEGWWRAVMDGSYRQWLAKNYAM
jgi:dTDP-glucose 4,6-dehydratase